MIVTLSSLGLPLLNGFIGEFAILRGVFEVNRMWAVWGVTGIVLGAAYLLWLYQRVMFGPVTNPANTNLPDLNLREYATLIPLVLWAFWIGIYPKPFFHYLDKPVERIVQQVNPDYYKQAVTMPALPAPVATAADAPQPVAAGSH
jgi:NADH-quinone oxidoreductase subunit M